MLSALALRESCMLAIICALSFCPAGTKLVGRGVFNTPLSRGNTRVGTTSTLLKPGGPLGPLGFCTPLHTQGLSVCCIC